MIYQLKCAKCGETVERELPWKYTTCFKCKIKRKNEFHKKAQEKKGYAQLKKISNEVFHKV